MYYIRGALSAASNYYKDLPAINPSTLTGKLSHAPPTAAHVLTNSLQAQSMSSSSRSLARTVAWNSHAPHSMFASASGKSSGLQTGWCAPHSLHSVASRAHFALCFLRSPSSSMASLFRST